MSREDGNDRRVYVGNLPPDIRNKVQIQDRQTVGYLVDAY